MGEVANALLNAARAMSQEQGYTWRDLAAAAKVGWDEARETCDNLKKADHLVVIGRHKPPGSNHWMRLYALPGGVVDSPCELTAVMATWVGPLDEEGGLGE